jgi:MoxR-like ATPase
VTKNSTPDHVPGITDEQSTWFATTFSDLCDNVELAVLGKRHAVETAFTAMVSEGHLLLEDVPGTGKTSLARAMAQSVNGTNTRVQFTPDLLPGDVTGITVFDQKKGAFEFHAGPIFANIVLADEINRASPKTQSALLEVMEEGQVTVDGVSRPTGSPFMVVATQNPVEQSGTYPLPEAQLDRFMMRTSLGYPDHASTLRILEAGRPPRVTVAAVVELETIAAMTALTREVHTSPLVLDYIARLVDATRNAAQVRLGVSMRGAMALARTSRTWALAHGRSYVTPDDVKTLADSVLAHRLILDPEAEFDGVTATAVIGQVLLDTLPPSHKDLE